MFAVWSLFQEQRLRGVALVAVVGFAVLLLAPALALADEYDDAYEQTEREYLALVDAAEKTGQRLKQAQDNLKRAEKALKKLPRSQRAAAKKHIAQIRKIMAPLKKQTKVFQKIVGFAGKGKSAFEAMKQLSSFKKSVQNLASGDLSKQMQELGSALEAYGGRVPFVGSILEAYGTMTKELVSATDKLSKKIQKNRNQDAISGPGVYKNPKGTKVEEQFGREFVDSGQIVRTTNYIYRRASKPDEFVLIWTGSRFEKLPGNVDAEQIYREHLVLRRYCPPERMAQYATHYDQYQLRKQDGKAIYDFLRKFTLDPKYGAAYDSMDWKVRGLVVTKNLDEFLARYAHDPRFNSYVRAVWLPQFKRKIMKLGFKERKFPKLKIGLVGPRATRKPKQTEKKCEIDDAKRERINRRLGAATPSQVASLFKLLMPAEAAAGLRNCICRVHSGAAGGVGVSYNPQPVNASPSCENPGNGPCVAQGFGCWRTPFKPDSQALESCGAANRLADAVCATRGK